MAKSETDVLNELRDALAAAGWTSVKLHGGVYQSGLPDLALIHPRGLTIWLEAKVHSFKSRATRDDLMSLLRGAPGKTGQKKLARQRVRGGAPSQYAVIRQWASRKVAVVVAAYDESFGEWCLADASSPLNGPTWCRHAMVAEFLEGVLRNHGFISER